MPVPPKKTWTAEPPRPWPSVEKDPLLTWPAEDQSQHTLTAPDAGLPGENAYDVAVTAGIIDYDTAKTREQVASEAERRRQLIIATQAAELDLERRKMELQVERGTLLTKAEHLERVEALVSSFNELLRLTISTACAYVPAHSSEIFTSRAKGRATAAMTALADCVHKRCTREQTEAALVAAFAEEQ